MDTSLQHISRHFSRPPKTPDRPRLPPLFLNSAFCFFFSAAPQPPLPFFVPASEETFTNLSTNLAIQLERYVSSLKLYYKNHATLHFFSNSPSWRICSASTLLLHFSSLFAPHQFLPRWRQKLVMPSFFVQSLRRTNQIAFIINIPHCANTLRNFFKPTPLTIPVHDGPTNGIVRPWTNWSASGQRRSPPSPKRVYDVVISDFFAQGCG